MQIDTGKISLIHRGPNGERAAQIECPLQLRPQPGQYLQAFSPEEPDSVLGRSLFPIGVPAPINDSVNSAPLSLAPIPPSWHPGTILELRGPLGRGFDFSVSFFRLGLVALGDTASRLLPLIPKTLEHGGDIAIFTDTLLFGLPTAVEIHPLGGLPEALAWADFLVIDLPLEKLSSLRKTLGLGPHDILPCPAQALISIPMPCAGIGECGVCAVPLRRKDYALTCKEGPVFDLRGLDW